MSLKKRPTCLTTGEASCRTLVLAAILAMLLCSNGVLAEPPFSPEKNEKTEKPLKPLSEVNTLNPAQLQSRLQNKEINIEEFIALKDQWIKSHPLAPVAAKSRPSDEEQAPLPKLKEDPTSDALAAIHRSAQTPEEQIRQVDLLLRNKAAQDPAQKESRQAQTPLRDLRPVPTDADTKAMQEILNHANKLKPEDRIAEIDRQQATLERHRKALEKKTQTSVQNYSIPTPPSNP